jgi:hypothetical protein
MGKFLSSATKILDLSTPSKYELRVSYFCIVDGTKKWNILAKSYFLDEVNFFLEKEELAISEDWLKRELSRLYSFLDSQSGSNIFVDNYYGRFTT